MKSFIELKPVKESSSDFEAIEARIKKVFRSLLYVPLLREFDLAQKTLHNDSDPLLEAVRLGHVTLIDGVFKGRFSAAVSRRLKELGCSWDRDERGFHVQKSLPKEVKDALQSLQASFAERLLRVEVFTAQKLPEKIAEAVLVVKELKAVLEKTDADLQTTLKALRVTPKLTPLQAERIAAEWQNNMTLWIKDFSETEIKKLRGDILTAAFRGDRQSQIVKAIQKSYGTTAAKAKFLARQETSLLLTKFKETRYTEAGVSEYKWGCVVGSKAHPVRPAHKKLEGQTFQWNNPPITTPPGESVRRNNPGADYNCRCFAKPIVRF